MPLNYDATSCAVSALQLSPRRESRAFRSFDRSPFDRPDPHRRRATRRATTRRWAPRRVLQAELAAAFRDLLRDDDDDDAGATATRDHLRRNRTKITAVLRDNRLATHPARRFAEWKIIIEDSVN